MYANTFSEKIIFEVSKFNAANDIDAPRAIGEDMNEEAGFILHTFGLANKFLEITSYLSRFFLPSSEKIAKSKLQLRQLYIIYYDKSIRHTQTQYFTNISSL
ncbi:MAG TPA: hypothetical protein VKB95_16695 [Chitinophagaceae bacterium]|nr:hypothetical protein [Chitinophagaceae bacterium]